MDNKNFRPAISLGFLILLISCRVSFANYNPVDKNTMNLSAMIKTISANSPLIKGILSQSSPESFRNTETQNLTYWKSYGYGYFAIMNSDTITLFQSTECSRVALGSLIMNDPYLFIGETPAATYQYVDTLFVVNMGKDLIFYQVDTLPDVMIDSSTDDPVVNFEVFWHTFKENCALFTLTNTNWDSLYTIYRPQVTETTHADSLFSIFCKMVSSLRDGHTAIIDTVNKKFYSPGVKNDYFWTEEPYLYFENIIQRLDNHEYTFTTNNYIFYGKIDQNIGYINISSMQDYVSPEMGMSDEEMISIVMDSLVDKFADCKSIILDIRLNSGGSDLVSYEIASRFNDQERVGYYRSYRTGDYDEFSEPKPVYTYTSERNLKDKKIVLLTSDHAYSAADVFAMLMKDIPNVTLIGEHTYGIFSDILDKILPNGWIVYLSNERYFSSEGINYEQIGIAPDIEEKMDSLSFFNGTDNVLEKAIDFLSITEVGPMISEPERIKVLSNPFANKAVIKVEMPNDEKAEISIYDTMGKIISRYEIHGSQTIEWDANAYSEGLYYCIFKKSETTQCLKLLHVK